MKRTLKSFAAILMVLTLCLGLMTACGSNSPVGKWKLSEATAAGVTVDVTELFGEMTIELKSDGTAIMTAMGETENGTWKQEGSKITIEGSEVKLEDGKLIMESEGAKMVFTRV